MEKEPELNTEIWKDIHDYNYQISTHGRIRNKQKLNILKIQISKNGYCTIKIQKKHFYLHILVASYFIPNPDNKKTVNHIDRNKQNNNINNIEWSTHKEQMQHVINNEKYIPSGCKNIIATNIKTDETITFDTVIEFCKVLKCSKTTLYYNRLELETNKYKVFDYIYVIDSKIPEDIDDTEHRIIKYCPDYLINTNGQIYSNKSSRYLSPVIVNNYYHINLAKTSWLVSRLVAEIFIPNPNNLPIVNHKNLNTLDNKVTNLEWVDNIGNAKHASENGCLKMVKICQFDINNKFIKCYNSRQDAELEADTDLYKVLNIKQEYCKNRYIWRYEKDCELTNNIYINKIEFWSYNALSKDICIFDKKYKFIEYHSDIDTVSKKYNIDNVSIHRLCQKNFRYKEKLHFKYSVQCKKVDNNTYIALLDRHKTGLKKQIPVLKFDKNKQFIKKFNSLRDAAESIGVKNGSTCISRVCKEKGFTTCKGFLWRYEHECNKINDIYKME